MTLKITSHPVRHLISGVTHGIKVFEFQGTNPEAPSVYIQAGLHAGELQGIGVIYALISYFKQYPPLGRVTLVPCANPFGLDVKMGEYTYGRFDPVTGENWNRQFYNVLENIDGKAFLKAHLHKSFSEIKELFKSLIRQTLLQQNEVQQNDGGFYGKSLALKLQSLAASNDCALDLHADSKSLPHVYTPDYAASNAAYLGAKYLIKTPQVFTPCFNQACFYPWWTLQTMYQDMTGFEVPPTFESFTFELGNKELFETEASRNFAQDILNYLRHKGIVHGKAILKEEPVTVAESDFIRLYAPWGGLVDYATPLGARVQKGDLLAHILKMEDDFTLTPFLSPASGVLLTQTSSGAVHQGSEIMKMMKI